MTGLSILRPPHFALLRFILFVWFTSRWVAADVQFTTPSAGQNVAAGTIEATWQDSGNAPSIEDLTAFTLTLMVGGNDDGSMLSLTTFVSQGTFAAGNKASGAIPSGIAGPVENGFFFRIISTAQAGGTVTNFSPRFNLTGLTGVTPVQYRNAVEGLSGSTDGPAAINPYSSSNSPSSSSNTSMSISATAIPAADSSTTAALSGFMTMTTTSYNGLATSTTSSTALPASTDSSGLSSGAKTGIAICSLLGGIALCASAVALVYVHQKRKHQKQMQRHMQKLPENPFLDHKAELWAMDPMSVPQTPVTTSELSHEGALVEADDGQPRPELDHMTFRAELEGSRPGTAT